MSKIKPKECQNVEFKISWNDKYLEWICGFANAQGAVMYFGVNDDHEVVGLKNTKKLLEDIPNKIVNYMGLVVDVNLYEQDGLEYIEVVIEPSNVPISYRGKYYYRSGSTMQELNGPALQQFVLKKMGRSWDDIPNEYTTIDDLDRSAIDYFLKKGHENGRITNEELNLPIEMLLQNLDLINEEGKLKNAALLLFAKRPQRYFASVRFQIGRFGVDEADLMFQDVIEGNIIQMADRVIDMLKAKYLTMPITFKGMNRIEKLEVPEEALREILYNAIIHKDYAGAHIQMHVWSDHVDVWNEGELPVGFTPDTLFEQHSSRPRNRNIANAFFKAGFIDAWGRGYKKIREGFESAGLPMPKVENFCGGVRVTFQRKSATENATENATTQKTTQKNVEKIVENSVEKSVEKVWRLIKQDSYITTKQIADAVGLSIRGIEENIKKLKREGRIRRVGGDNGGHWEVIE